VMFRPKPDLTTEQRRALADTLAASIRAIPSVKGARVGRRVKTGWPYEQMMRADYTHVAVLEFDDHDGLVEYLRHPAHQELAMRFFDSFEEALVYDYELEPAATGIPKLV
jgi:hypothetical protein